MTLAGPFTVTDDRAGTLSASGPLAPLGTVTVTGTYTITQADLDAGSVVNSAYATATYDGKTVTSNTDTATGTGTQVARISIQKLTHGEDVAAPPGAVHRGRFSGHVDVLRQEPGQRDLGRGYGE